MKFKIKCLCGQQLMIITRSQRKVIRCPSCNQKIEAIAPADEHSMSELTGAIFDDPPFQQAFAQLPFPSPDQQPQYHSKIVKRPTSQYTKSSSGFNWVPVVVTTFLGGLIVLCIVLLLLPERQVDLGDDQEDSRTTARNEDKRGGRDDAGLNFPAELRRPNVFDRFGNATIELDVLIGNRDVFTKAGKVMWIVKSDSGQRFEKNITYKMIYGLDDEGVISFDLDQKIQRYPIQTYLEAVVDPDVGKVEVVSNVLVIDSDGRVLGR